MHPKVIVGGFEFTVRQTNLKEWYKRPWTRLRVLKESNKGRYDGYTARNSVLIVSQISFWDCSVRIFLRQSFSN